MRIRRSLLSLLAATALALSARTALAAAGGTTAAASSEERSLLAPDGTLYSVRSGYASDLGLSGGSVGPTDCVVAWSRRLQDGGVSQGVVPDTAGHSLKSNLQLAFDEPTGSLVVLWNENFTVLNVLRLGIFRDGAWTLANLLPNLGFAHAYNPRMLLTHPVIHELDANGNDVWKTRSILHVVFWEESGVSQARYAPMFVDEDASASDVQVYDLPATVGGGGPTPASDVPAGAYRYPSLQLEGPGGGILASFTDLAAGRHRTVHINFPTELGKPGSTNLTWLRRREPIIGAALEAPIPRMAPRDGSIPIRTFIGTGYRPTLAWRDDSAVRFLRFDGQNWSDVKSVALDDGMSDEKAIGLVQDMATKN